MQKRILTIGLVFLLVLSSSFIPISIGYDIKLLDTKEQTFRENIKKQGIRHNSIYIFNDSDFTENNGVIDGTGDINDPFIICGWELYYLYIQGSKENPITKYFIIVNCSIIIKLKIENILDGRCLCLKNSIFLLSSYNMKQRIYLYCANYVNIENCTFFITECNGIETTIGSNVKHLIIRNCSFISQHKHDSFAVILDDYGLIENCYFADSNVGISAANFCFIKNCTFENSNDEGIVIFGDFNLIEDCVFNDEYMAIEFGTANCNNIVRNCIFNRNFNAIMFLIIMGGYHKNNVIENCFFNDGIQAGIDLLNSINISIRNCSFNNMNEELHGGAIVLRDLDQDSGLVTDSKIYSNYFISCAKAINLCPTNKYNVYNNVFYDNFFLGNKIDVVQENNGDANKQKWNIKKTVGFNIVGGSYLGGNFWDDYIGEDNDNDGIGDTGYHILNYYAWDNLPLYNLAPLTPTINGVRVGIAGNKYDYCFNTTDPVNEEISYFIDWGDGNQSVWIGPFKSGEEIKVSHKWNINGVYTIKTKSRDVYYIESNWRTFEVAIPRTRTLYDFNWLSFLESFPILQKFLNKF